MYIPLLFRGEALSEGVKNVGDRNTVVTFTSSNFVYGIIVHEIIIGVTDIWLIWNSSNMMGVFKKFNICPQLIQS